MAGWCGSIDAEAGGHFCSHAIVPVLLSADIKTFVLCEADDEAGEGADGAAENAEAFRFLGGCEGKPMVWVVVALGEAEEEASAGADGEADEG